jgi:release factor glutamine methyltransferase
LAQTWTVLKILQWTTDYFHDKGIESPRRDAELLLGASLGLDRVGLYLHFDRPLEESELSAYRALVVRRAKREPLQYILGETEFWSLPFCVSPAVLIPRPDTEVLVEESLRLAGGHRILDVGTGSGAIAVALAHELADAQVVALDISPDALAVAERNARRNSVEDRITFLQGDLAHLPAGPFDLIVSNPPYIPAADVEGLMPEVREFEPRQALVGGSDGLDPYRALARQASFCLVPGGWLLVEVGIYQASDVQRLFADAGLKEVFCRDDYGGVPRVVGARTGVVDRAV